MGLAYRVDISYYNDDQHTELIPCYSGYLYVAQINANKALPTSTNVNDNTPIKFFDPYLLNDSEFVYLGGFYTTRSDGTPNGYPPTRFLPVAQMVANFTFSRGYRIIFRKRNGSGITGYMDCFTPANHFPKEYIFYDTNGTQIGTFRDQHRFVECLENNFYACRCLVAESIVGTTISGDLYSFYEDAHYSDGWKNYLWGEKITNSTTDLIAFLNGYTDPITADPFSRGGYNEEDGGDGDWDNTSGVSPEVILPTMSAANSGFLNIYNPTIAEAKQFANFLHSNNLALQIYKTFFGNVQECVLGFGILPYVFSALEVERINDVIVGNTRSQVGMDRVIPQYVSVDMGEIMLDEFFGSYLDYSPNTQIEIYLPYIGVKSIDPDLVMGHGVRVIYYIDVGTGACIAHIISRTAILYSFSGECLSQIPINQLDMSAAIQANISMAVSIVGNVIAMAATEGASTALNAMSIVHSAATNAPNMFKPHIQKTGSLSSNIGMLSPQTPYLIITRKRPAVPDTFDIHYGYTSNIKSTLSALGGYVEVASIHLENVPATSDEIDEIVSILSEGVLI